MAGYSPERLRRAMLLYAVTDSAWLGGRELSECVSAAVSGGATFVQLREKNLGFEEMVSLARVLQPICADEGVPFVVNDKVEVAQAVDADGVHVGQSDRACASARALLGPDKIVGVSVGTLAEALKAQADGADYLGVGALFTTATKLDAGEVSAAKLKAICEAVRIPVVAIGGLNVATIPALAGSGVDGAAVVSAIFAADDIERNTRALLEVIEETLDFRSI